MSLVAATSLFRSFYPLECEWWHRCHPEDHLNAERAFWCLEDMRQSLRSRKGKQPETRRQAFSLWATAVVARESERRDKKYHDLTASLKAIRQHKCIYLSIYCINLYIDKIIQYRPSSIRFAKFAADLNLDSLIFAAEFLIGTNDVLGRKICIEIYKI